MRSSKHQLKACQVYADYISKCIFILSWKNASAKDSHFSNKNINLFVIFMLEIFKETLTNIVVNFEQPAPVGDYLSMEVSDLHLL